MGWLAFFGCGLTAYSPILTLFFATVSGSAQHVILSLAAAFFWLIALLIVSLVWYLATPIRGLHPVTVLYGVLVQEAFRYLYYLLYARAEKGLNTVSKNPGSGHNRPMFAFVSGMGFGLVGALISYVSLLANTLGPGTMYTKSCPTVSLAFISAIQTAIFSLLQVVWMLIAFDAFTEPKPAPAASGHSAPAYPTSPMHAARTGFGKWWRLSWVLLSHLAASYATLMNTYIGVDLGCAYSIIVLVAVLAVSIGIAAHSMVRQWR